MVKNIQLTVSEKNVTSEDCPLRWSSNTVDYITATFALDDEWKSCDLVRAVWVAPQAQIVTVLDANGTCVVPHEVLSKIGKVYVNLYGIVYEEGDEFTRITTYPFNAIRIDGDAKIEGSETAPITPSQFEQFVDTVLSETKKVTGMTATAETLPAGEDATASYNDGVLSFGIPQGEQGIQGIQGIPGERGETGATGNGIESVTKTGTSGLVDTYTILFTDGTSTTFTVTNGQDGSADIHWGDVQGSIANQTDLQNALNAKQNKLTAGENITIDANNVISATGGSGGGAVDSVNGKTGVVVLTASDLGAYVKPTNGIPKTDLASAVRTSLDKADTALQSAPVTSVNSKTGAVSLTASDLGAYTKPGTGIPKSDLASAVQTSLEKADTALQSAPVNSVNGKTGAVTLTASDVGALPSTTAIPTKTSDLTNDSGFLTSAGAVTSFNGQHGAVTYTAPVQSVNGQTGAVTVPDTDTTYTLSMAGNVITLTPSSGTASSITLPVSETEWGDITGTLANQTDLQTALNAKASVWTVQTMTASDTVVTLNPNVFYIFPEMATLTVTMSGTGMHAFRFTSGATATTLTVNGATMPDSFEVESGKVYEVNIYQGYGVVSEWTA